MLTLAGMDTFRLWKKWVQIRYPFYFNAFWDPSTRYFVLFRSTDGMTWDLVVRGNPTPVSTYVRAFFLRRTGSGTTMQLVDAIDLSSMDPLFPY